MTKAVQDLMVAVERVVDAFHTAVFDAGDVDAAMRTVTDDVVLATLPVGTGATGAVALRRHLADDVVGHRPADLTFRRLSRTGNRWTVADERVVSFTHDRVLPWLLPGIAATHRHVEVLATSVVAVQRDRVVRHRTLWDHHGLLTGLGLLPDAAGSTSRT
jgi:carboxymethylenebutenolidase